MQLFKAEYWNFNCYILSFWVQTDSVTLVTQFFAEHHAGSNLNHRYAVLRQLFEVRFTQRTQRTAEQAFGNTFCRL